MRHGLCRGATNLFYPDRGDNHAVKAAKALCWSCPVQAECLDYSLLNREKFGVWGGFSERERRRMRPNQAARAFAFARIKARQQGVA
jgi:hypothetical protein